MDIEVVPITDFVHGRITAREGHPLPMGESLAADLERAGLVRIKLAPVVGNVDANKAAAGKVADDGLGKPLSASPAAPASAPKTLLPSKPGTGKKGSKEK